MPLKQKISPVEIFIILTAAFCFSYALYIAIKYSGQAPLDMYSFRQTQTALTAFWLGKNGFSLAYETPVAGSPWSIPFEFPIYQYIVALLSQLTRCSLDVTGRLVSFLFLALCLIPAQFITRQLKLSPLVFYIFAALLFSSPLYLYWGRTFMIETAAVFFCIAAIKYFIDIIQTKNSFKSSLLFFIFINLCILQKATTGLPILGILGLVYIFTSIKDLTTNTTTESSSIRIFLTRKIILALVYFGLPLAIGVIWTLYTDHIKELNSLGINLTSSALSQWNWGSLKQRLSSPLYFDVIWTRIFKQNLAGAIGAVVLLFALLSNVEKSIKTVIAISLAMGFAPLFLFTNLHLVHTYYQTAIVVFLIYATAVSIGHVLNIYLKRKILLFAITITMIGANYFIFSRYFLETIKTEFNKENSRDYAVSEILKREIPQDKYFVAFGNDWSSSFAYLAERKSFTAPGFLKEYKNLASSPERLIEEAHLGGVVLCPWGGTPSIIDLSQWASTNRRWKIGEAHGCYIALPETKLVDKTTIYSQTECQGNLEFAGVTPGVDRRILSIAGWTTVSGEKGILPEKIYITLAQKNAEPMYFEALQVNRPDVNAYFKKPNDLDSGFSRIINTNSLSGKYVVGVIRSSQGRLETCQFQKEVSINSEGVNDNR